MNRKFGTRTTALAAFLFLLALGACKETNITEIIEPGNEGTGKDSLYYSTSWIVEAAAMNYLGIEAPDRLFPSYILQANGLRRMYAGSPFARELITEDIFVSFLNPGKGTKITLIMAGSEINEELSRSIYIGDQYGDTDTLTLRFPVDWKRQVLCHWRADRSVNLRWDISFDDRPVETYKRTFTCCSVNAVTYGFKVVQRDGPEMYAHFKQFDYGNFPCAESGDTLSISLEDLIAGYIDENSPLIERMKRELIEDGYTNFIWGAAAYEDEQVVDGVRNFNYLMLKHGVTYGIRNGNTMQYMRGIDEVFANRNGYCSELSAAFASWCINLGIKSQLYSIPGHVYPIVQMLDGSPYPWDPNLLCLYVDNYPDLGEFTEEKREAVDWLFDIVAEGSRGNYEWDLESEAHSPIDFHTVDVTMLRYYLPSFNASEEYWSTTLSRSTGNEMRIVERPRWFKHEEKTMREPSRVEREAAEKVGFASDDYPLRLPVTRGDR